MLNVNFELKVKVDVNTFSHKHNAMRAAVNNHWVKQHGGVCGDQGLCSGDTMVPTT